MNEIKQVTGTGVPLFLDDIDTDRIIPARYLRCVTFDGLGENVFEDDRQQTAGTHPFDDARFASGSILVSGRNFGCGSSREHAPQALIRWGIKAVIAESFAEIFFGNCTSLGVPAVCMSRDELETLSKLVEADPTAELTVDLDAGQVHVAGRDIPCTIPESAKTALVSGEWDFLSQLLEAKDDIQKHASELPYLNQFV